MWKKLLILLGIIVLGGVGYVAWLYRVKPVIPDLPEIATDRDAVLPPTDDSGSAVIQVKYLNQGWSPNDSMEFYTLSQGSRLVPYLWFVNLEQSTSEKPFLDPVHLNRFRFLQLKKAEYNPDGLPIGFVRDPRRSDEPQGRNWLGLTCAACHTNEIHHNQVAYRIDGAPSHQDIGGFLLELTAAMKATLNTPAKFDRFAEKIMASSLRDAPDQSKEQLRQELQAQLTIREKYDATNASPHPYGYARLDAFGRIMNAVYVDGLKTPASRKNTDAPVSYPFLWDTPQHDFVQWNGVANNVLIGSKRLGALARNTGEVLGVFGQIEMQPEGGTLKPGYPSSVNMSHLDRLEELVTKLHSPEWPESFGKLDEAKVTAGKAVFEKYCIGCHVPIIDHKNPNRTVKAFKTPVTEVRTDHTMASNFAFRTGDSAFLKGTKKFIVPISFPGNKTIGTSISGDDLLLNAVVGSILRGPFNDTSDPDKKRFLEEYSNRKMLDTTRDLGVLPPQMTTMSLELAPPELVNPLMVYKARPLNGIWATAPYLHNGSVPNLKELLLPVEKRSKSFAIGSREFDPVNVGFSTKNYPGAFLFDTSLPGNSNDGHEYGTGKSKLQGGDGLPVMKPEEIEQLLEYLKSE
ncbi:MAG: di-heme-cytochrome C peroxidase [Fimbriiglobus sp.]